MGLTLNTLSITSGQAVSITSWTHTVPAGSGSNPVLSNAVRSAACDAMVDLIDAGAGAGYLRIRDASNVTLVDIPLNDAAFGAAVNGVATADVSPVPSANAVATGTANNYQVFDSNNTLLWSSSNVST